jgi:hypothetical protein
MKFKLTEDHQVRLSDKILKAGVYTIEELEKAHSHDSLEFCVKYTKLGKKLAPYVEETQVKDKSKKKEKNV